MKKGTVLEGIVNKIQFPNKGIVEVDGEKAIVKNALPGQNVRFVVNKSRKGKGEGRLLEVLERSPREWDKESWKEQVCPHFEICGGCLYQSLPYEEQLKIKEEQVKELIDSVCANPEYEFQGIKASPLYQGYRNKMEFSFGDEYKGGPLSLGMHKRGSFYDIVSTPECRIVHPDFRKLLVATKEYFSQKGIDFYKKLAHTGYLRHLLVRRAVKTGEILVVLVTSSQMDKGETELLEGWKEGILALPLEGTLSGILHTVNDSLADVVQSDRTDILYGRDYFYEELLGLKFKISPFSFFQTNSLGAEVLYEAARSYVGETKDKVVFDLYSGTGTIAQILAPVAQKVVGVEIVEEAVEAAKINAELNGLTNCRFIAGDVLKVIDNVEERPDLIVVDPPRDGIHPKALPKIIAYQVPKIVYISCKPTSLVRDMAMFQEMGYVVEKVCAVDMFPGTGNVETCVLLSRKKSGGKSTKIEIEIDLSEADRRECIGTATYQEIKNYVWEHYQTKVSHLYIAQIKKKYGLKVGENFNKSKTEGNKVPNCPPEKERMIREALEYFGMINKE